jgi:hypothetical protein
MPGLPDPLHRDTWVEQSTQGPLPRSQDLPEVLRHPCTRLPRKLVNRDTGRVGVPIHPTGGNRNGRNGQRYPVVYAGYPWLAFGYGAPLGYSVPYAGDGDATDGPSPMPQQQADEASIDYGAEPPSPQVAGDGAPSFRQPYQGAYQGPSQAAPVHAQPATVLIFKDGRPPEKVHNYALTGSTLYALDGDLRREIPLALLNVPATVETNRAAGVDFSLPMSR